MGSGHNGGPHPVSSASRAHDATFSIALAPFDPVNSPFVRILLSSPTFSSNL